MKDKLVIKCKQNFKKNLNFSLNILYFYKSPTVQVSAEDWNVKDVFVPQVPQEWDVGCVLLQDDFPLQYSTFLDSTKHICIQPEVSQKSPKLEPALNKVNKEIKKLSD